MLWRDEKNKNIVEEEIKEIINTDYSKLTVEQLSFYCQYISNCMLGSYNFRNNVVIGNDYGKNGIFIRGFQSHNHIFINKIAFNNIAELTKTICHETQHSIQEYKNEEKIPNISWKLYK